jgi:lipopolysaccharide/colanic/teichoic acid biosynthesis glycosyltransferase
MERNTGSEDTRISANERDSVSSARMLDAQLGTRTRTKWDHRLKRAMDVAAAGAGLLFLSPALLSIAAAVKFDSPGPALFRQRRLGRHSAVFEILKFRTMRAGSSVVIAADHTVSNPIEDARVTRFGRILRETSLDELPQLINVFVGEMSLVGPRPDLPEAIGMYRDDEADKLRVRPGITGPAQVLGRNALEAHEKWRLDAEYAREGDLRADLRILAMTIAKVLSREGIYREKV